MTTRYEVFTIRSIHNMAMPERTALLCGAFYGTTSKKLKKVEDIYLTRRDQFKGNETTLTLTSQPLELIDRIVSEVSKGKTDVYQHTELVLQYEGKRLVDVRISTSQI